MLFHGSVLLSTYEIKEMKKKEQKVRIVPNIELFIRTDWNQDCHCSWRFCQSLGKFLSLLTILKPSKGYNEDFPFYRQKVSIKHADIDES